MAQSLTQVEQQVAHLAERLASEYADRVPESVVRGLVDEAYDPLRAARVSQFVPVLVDRTVRNKLRTTGG
jgi:hypothetical protein